MRLQSDVDVVILMATQLSSKRRPAELAEIVAAADMLQGRVPFADKLGGAIERLSMFGLIAEIDSGFSLTELAQEIIAGLPKRRSNDDLLLELKEALGMQMLKPDRDAIVLTRIQLDTAIHAHKAAKKSPGKNMLMPKPEPDRHFKLEGRWRRVPGKR